MVPKDPLNHKKRFAFLPGSSILLLPVLLLGGCGGGEKPSSGQTIELRYELPPDTVILSGPPPLTRDTEVTFEFQGSLTSATFLCSFDRSAPAPCTSPHTIANLTEGEHLFEVSAVSSAGLSDPLPARYSFEVDRTPPQVRLGNAPPAMTREVFLVIPFQASEEASGECSVDGAPFLPCASPWVVGPLEEGSHEFTLVVVDRAGNRSAPLVITVAVDATPPRTILLTAPLPVTSSPVQVFEFQSTEPGSRSFCSLDASAFYPCTSPVSVTPGEGEHTFSIYAVDPLGNREPVPLTYRYRVDLAPPDTLLVSGPNSPINVTVVTVRFTGTEEGSRFYCRMDGGLYSGCSSPKVYSGVGEGQHLIEVTSVDRAGNVDVTPLSIGFRVDLTPPSLVWLVTPPAVTNGSFVRFIVTAPNEVTDAQLVRFWCILDGLGYQDCTGPVSGGVPWGIWYGEVFEGTHTFGVYGVDGAGNRGLQVVTSVVVDLTPPDTVIVSGPSALTNVSVASFTFTAVGGVGFECSLDRGVWQACTSPKSYTGLGDGVHSFEVRARDSVGNWDPTPAEWLWEVDTTPVNLTVSFLSTPNTMHENYNVGYTFFSSDSGASFECSWDGDPWQPCATSSGKSWVSPGLHLFRVRARDPWGNYSPEVSHTFAAVSCDGTNLLCSIVGVDPTLYSFTESNPLRVPVEFMARIALDEATGNLYISDYNGCRIYKVTPQGSVQALAGTGVCAFSPNGSNLAVNPINYAGDLAFYRFPTGEQYLYYVETFAHCVRRFRVDTTPLVETVAGICNSSGFADGAATSARFTSPLGITVSSELSGSHPEIYVADTSNHRVRKIANGNVSTLAGNGTPTSSGCGNLGDGGPGGSATLNLPFDAAIQGGNLLIADTFNNLVRSVPRNGGNIFTIAGQCQLSGYSDNVTAGAARLNLPFSLYVDPYRGGYWLAMNLGQLAWVEGYLPSSLLHQAFPPGDGFGNYGDFRGRMEGHYNPVRSVQGDATGVYFGTDRAVKYMVVYSSLGSGNFLLPVFGPSNDQHGVYPDLPASQAPLGYVFAVTVSATGKLAYLESGSPGSVRVVENGISRKVADLSGGLDMDWDPSGLTVYVSSSDHKVYAIDTVTNYTTVLAGSSAGYQEGTGTNAKFNTPWGLWMDPIGRELYVADTGNHCIRKVNLATKATTLVSGLCGSPGNTPHPDTGPVSLLSARYNLPYDLVGDPYSSNPPVLYVADTFNFKVRVLLQGSNQAYTFLGSGTEGSCPSGTNYLQAIPRPYAIALDHRPIFNGGKALILAGSSHLYRAPLASGSTIATIASQPCGRTGFYGHRDNALNAHLLIGYLTRIVYSPPVPGVFPAPGYIFGDRGVGRIFRIQNP